MDVADTIARTVSDAGLVHACQSVRHGTKEREGVRGVDGSSLGPAVPPPGRAPADQHLDEVRSRARDEGHARLARHRASQQRLARARRTCTTTTTTTDGSPPTSCLPLNTALSSTFSLPRPSSPESSMPLGSLAPMATYRLRSLRKSTISADDPPITKSKAMTTTTTVRKASSYTAPCTGIDPRQRVTGRHVMPAIRCQQSACLARP